MGTYKLLQVLSDLKLEETKTELESIVARARMKRTAILERHNILIKRKTHLKKENGGSDVSSSDIIKLNIGGKKMTFTRNVLTCVKGSRLEILFSGRWENKILRDKEGCIFLDIDPSYFVKGIEQILTKISNDNNDTSMISDLQVDDECSLLFAYLFTEEPKSRAEQQMSTNEEQTLESMLPCKTFPCEDNLKSIIIKEERLSLVTENKLKMIEDRLDDEESFINYFLHQADEDIVTGIEDEVVTLELLSGVRISVKVSTLPFHNPLVLAGEERDSKHVVVTKEHDVLFKKMINRLRLRAFLQPEFQIQKMCFKTEEDVVPFYNYVSTYFAGYKERIFGIHPFDSCILTKFEDNIDIVSLLPSTCASNAPQLLYRASRDGWGLDAFLLKCKGKVNTITVIKSTEGNVFGGYLDSSWQISLNIASNHAFLFFLKHDEQLASSIKMSLTNAFGVGGYVAYATTAHYGFGCKKERKYDLHISSNANSNKKSFTSFGGIYDNLSNHSDPTHSDRKRRCFQAIEIEVFELMSK